MDILQTIGYSALVVIGFSVIIFVHEVGHFLAAKWMGVRVDRFAIGFFQRVCGYRRGEGFTFGTRPNYRPEELAARGFGETDYCLNALPFGGYVKMLGEDDIIINEQTGEMKTTDDPRAFNNKPVSRRVVVVSAGVVFNVVFAILLYTFVYAGPGKIVMAPRIGHVEACSPAASAGVLVGDRVLSVNGKTVYSFDEIFMRAVLSDGPLRLTIERGQHALEREFVVMREPGDSPSAMLGGLVLTVTATLSEEVLGLPGAHQFKPGDRVTHVNGRPVDNWAQIRVAIAESGGAPLEFTVERRISDQAQPEILSRVICPVLALGLADVEDTPAAAKRDGRHLLGLRRRWAVDSPQPGSPGLAAGFQRGDVVVQWGNVANPLMREITDSTVNSNGIPIPVVVERDGKRIELTVTPRRKFQLFGTAPVQVGVPFTEETGRPIVADVAPGTPAAELGLPRGAELVAIGEHSVTSWSDVCNVLAAAAGTVVSVRYRTGVDEAEGRLSVPSSVVNELNLPASARICSIGGEQAFTTPAGKRVPLPDSFAVRKLLEKNIGRTVDLEVSQSPLDLQTQTRHFAVRADNTDPWQMRAQYDVELGNLGRCFAVATDTVTTGGHVGRALLMAVDRAGEDLRGVYEIMKRVVQSFVVREKTHVSMQNISGPVGIVRNAVQQAQSGIGELLHFLAYISVNLAVINFLPLPVVDGGLMLFLLLEKLRGKPLSLKVQIATTLAGLALIVLSFAVVTFQDIVKWWSGTL